MSGLSAAFDRMWEELRFDPPRLRHGHLVLTEGHQIPAAAFARDPEGILRRLRSPSKINLPESLDWLEGLA